MLLSALTCSLSLGIPASKLGRPSCWYIPLQLFTVCQPCPVRPFWQPRQASRCLDWRSFQQRWHEGEGSHGQTGTTSRDRQWASPPPLGAQFPCWWSEAAFLWGHLECKQREEVMGSGASCVNALWKIFIASSPAPKPIFVNFSLVFSLCNDCGCKCVLSRSYFEGLILSIPCAFRDQAIHFCFQLNC